MREQALQVAVHHCDTLKVVEEGGANRGKWIDAYLAMCGLGTGYPWCAAFVTYCLVKGGCRLSALPVGPASTYSWWMWSHKKGYRHGDPSKLRRGDLFVWNKPNRSGARVGHIGFVVESRKAFGLWWLRTIEGNSNDDGSREGTRVVRRGRQGLPGVIGWRRVTGDIRFIALPEEL